MDKYAFIGHPMSIAHFRNLSGPLNLSLEGLNDYEIKETMMSLPPYKYNLMKVTSITGDKSEGFGIILPLLPEQVVSLGEQNALRRILEAVILAKDLGTKLIGLGGFTSVVGNEGEYISKLVDVAVSSGNTYPAYLSIKGILKACEILEKNISSTTATVVGATGDIGSICTKILSKKVRKLYIVARDYEKIFKFYEELKRISRAEVAIPEDLDSAVNNSDIILTATTSITSIINPQKLKPGSIVCDVAVPANVTKDVVKARNDVLVFEGGLTKLPNFENIKDENFHKAMLYKNCIFGCLGEIMLLSLEKRFESFSLGRGNITEKKFEEIGRIAEKHGFDVSDFFCGYKTYSSSDIKTIKENSKV